MTGVFEENIRLLTKPINGQLPRPWMTDVANPVDANVFVVGRNQATTYCAALIPRQRHMNALFNRNGESCRALYDEVRGGKPSPTRRNIDCFVAKRKRRGVLVETDVVCYSTRKSADLKHADHAGGRARGEEIFGYVLKTIAPTVLIVYGKVPRKLSRAS